MSLRLNGSTSGYSEIDAPAIAGNNTLVLPTTNGAANQLLKNGSTPGVLEYASMTLDSAGNLGSVASINDGPLAGMRNRIINGNFAIGQRGTTFPSGFNNNDAYTLDRWYILSDGNDAIDVTRETSVVPTNQKYAIALDVETANKKFGIAQIIESDNCVGLTGGTVTLSFKAKVSATTKLDNVKAAVVAWSGTADTVTSDIISAWGAEDTNPTLIANATYENTPANLSVTTSYATYSVTANIDTASTTNIIVFIWSDVTDTTAGDFLYVTDVQLEPGPVATPFEQRPIGTELALCQRYFHVSRVYGWGYASGAGNTRIGTSYFQVEMRTATPTVAFTSATGSNVSGQTTENLTSKMFGVFTSAVAAGAMNLDLTYTASAEL
jgi:hypothetical protein